jgi:hypothetical protein
LKKIQQWKVSMPDMSADRHEASARWLIRAVLLVLILFFAVAAVQFYSWIKGEDMPAGISVSDLPEPVAQAARAVYKFTIYDRCHDSAPINGGSAIVSGDTFITARHIFDAMQREVREEYPLSCLQQELVSYDRADTIRLSLAHVDYKFFKDVVRVSMRGVASRSGIACFSTTYAVGDTVYLVGYPGRRQRSFTAYANEIVSTYVPRMGRFVATKGDLIGPGMSGGAAIDRRGCVIGVLSRLDQRDRINFAAPFTGLSDWVPITKGPR